VEITDKGIGIPEERLAEMNWRLRSTPVIDVTVSRHMGLFAVARLAERHNVQVRLRPASPQGLSALVWLPDTVIERTGRQYGGGRVPQAAQAAQAAQGGAGLQVRRTPGQSLTAPPAADAQPGQRGTGAARGGLATAGEPVDWFRNPRDQGAGTGTAERTDM
jgi:hypothetical protein